MTLVPTDREDDTRLVVRPLVTAEQAIREFADYQDLVRRLLDPSDYQTYFQGGRKQQFKKKSAWRKMRRFFGFHIELRDERIGHRHSKVDCPRLTIPDEKDCGCPTVYARYVVRATDPRTGQYVDGIGVSSTSEKNRVFTKPDHEIPATAYTRAANRAISDLIGAGEDSAEEVRGTQDAQGLPEEDRTTIKAAWVAATPDVREKAVAQMREWGFKGGGIGELFTDFSLRAGEDAVNDLLAVLTGHEPEPFDPDAVVGVAS